MLQTPRRRPCKLGAGTVTADKAGRFLIFVIDELALGWTKTHNRVVVVAIRMAKTLALRTNPADLLTRAEF